MSTTQGFIYARMNEVIEIINPSPPPFESSDSEYSVSVHGTVDNLPRRSILGGGLQRAVAVCSPNVDWLREEIHLNNLEVNRGTIYRTLSFNLTSTSYVETYFSGYEYNAGVTGRSAGSYYSPIACGKIEYFPTPSPGPTQPPDRLDTAPNYRHCNRNNCFIRSLPAVLAIFLHNKYRSPLANKTSSADESAPRKGGGAPVQEEPKSVNLT